ncbi:hypothetical protein TCAL_11663 [Tigriopus californicus]|uniref:Mediator of RNA polymerase II transcription subunit 27 n=1 Tax=Tigriopus californicus TaxID=6832 RepID=A0A553NCJ7_TIGCA|nr:hypothetical protein TCAL_11663 [Tigriopus californicus]
MSQSTDLQHLHSALRLITEIRARSGKLLQNVADGMAVKHGDENKEKRFLSELKTLLDGVSGQIGELEQTLNNQPPISNPLPLGQSVYLSLDTAIDSIPIYQNLVSSYRWLDKTHEYASSAAGFLGQNSLNRSIGKVSKNRRRPNTSHTAPPKSVTLDRILKAILIFKGLMIEWVVVKGFNEESTKPDGSLDVWSDSKYQVFQRITENANAAMLNFQSPLYPELGVKSFMTYLHSFLKLFTEKCKKCGYHLHNNIPPTWREFKTLEPFHEDCRP